MCTAIRYKKHMGRNYDYETSYDETIATIPQNEYGNKYCMIGVSAGMIKEYPLWYDAMNEHGLCMSALAFTGNAHYNKNFENKDNIPSYRLITEIIGNNKTVESAKNHLAEINITDEQYSDQLTNSDLHWFICDKNKSITVEQTEKGLKVYDNPYDTLTNNPPFDLMEKSIRWFDEKMGGDYPTGTYSSRGTETLGIKGDTTSISRFHRVHQYMMMMENTRANVCMDDVSTFHLLDLVKQTWGATPVNGEYEYTIYSAVYDMENLEIIVKPYTSTMVKRIPLRNKSMRWKI